MAIDRDRLGFVREQFAVLLDRAAIVGEGRRHSPGRPCDATAPLRRRAAGRTCSSVRRPWPARAARRRSRPASAAVRAHNRGRAAARARLPPITRTTELSTRRAMARSCSRKCSAMLRSRCECLVVVDALRLVGQVAAGHHQRTIDVAQQQVMQRRARQHEAERCQARAHAGQRIRRQRVQHHDRRGHAAQRGRVRSPSPRRSGGSRRRRAPSARTVLRRAASPCAAVRPRWRWWHRRRGESRPAPSSRRCGRPAAAPAPHRSHRRAQLRLQPDPRTARGAGDRLRMEAAVRRIAVFRRAGSAHAERAHRGRGAVVGDRLDDRQPRTAMRAVGERIAITARCRVEYLLAAGRTGRRIRHHAGVDSASAASHDAKVAASPAGPSVGVRSIASMRASGGGARASSATKPEMPSRRTATDSDARRRRCRPSRAGRGGAPAARPSGGSRRPAPGHARGSVRHSPSPWLPMHPADRGTGWLPER